MLEAPVEGEWGEIVEEEYLTLIANAGFQHVRIPIRWNAHANVTAPYTIDGAFMARVDEVVNWAISAGLSVIINIHHYEELWANPEAERARFLGLWEQIASHYSTLPPSVLMEVINEPIWEIPAATVNSLLADAVSVIRQSNPTRTLVLGGYRYNHPLYMDALEVPEGETNVIGTFHMYEPFNFTHSGATWIVPVPPAGATWAGTPADEQAVDDLLALAIAWSERTGFPIHMGEFGAIRTAEQASRVRWTSYLVERALALNIPFSYWEWCTSVFGVYDNDTGTWDEAIRGALLD